MNKMLKYWTQPHERTNIAFSIAYDVYDENKPFKSDKIEFLINAHLQCWKKYHENNNLEYFDIYIRNIQKLGSLILFAIIFYRQELTFRQELGPEFILSVPRTLELVKKYYKRLGGILINSKNNTTWFRI